MQQGQRPTSRTSQGCSACSTFSHVAPEGFLAAQVDHQHEQIGYGRQCQVVVKAKSGPALVVVQPQIGLVALKELLHGKASPAQPQAT